MKKFTSHHKKNFILTICATLLISNTINFTPKLDSYADTKLNITNTTEETENNNFSPFFGQQFLEPNFTEIITISSENLDNTTIKEHLKNNIKSARWKATFTPTTTGIHTFNAPNGFNIFINDKKIVNNQIDLLTAQNYDLYINAPDLTNLDINNITDINFTVNNGEKNFLDTNFVTDTKNKNFTTNQENSTRKKRSLPEYDTLLDSDDDGITDAWETNGYTRMGNNLVAWKEEYAPKGYTKYISSPYEKYTANDPFGDYDKALGRIDRLIDKAAHNPLVAAVPNMSVTKEKIILSKNQNVTEDTGNTIDTSKSTNKSVNHSWGIDASVTGSLGFRGWDVSATLSSHQSQTNETGIQYSEAKQKNWSKAFNLNEAESAYINANIRYQNHGTAPIYDAKPTLNFVLGKDTLATISMKENQIAKILSPKTTYPTSNQAALAVLTEDDFAASPIKINKNQLDRFNSGETFRIQTTQYTGKIGRYSPGSNHPTLTDEWGHVTESVYKNTAGFSLTLDNGETLERRIAAKNPDDIYDTTPQITVKEALKIGFQAVENKHGNLVMKDKVSGKKYYLNKNNMSIISDQKTKDLVKANMRTKNNRIAAFYDLIITPNMVFHIDVVNNQVKFGTHAETNKK